MIPPSSVEACDVFISTKLLTIQGLAILFLIILLTVVSSLSALGKGGLFPPLPFSLDFAWDEKRSNSLISTPSKDIREETLGDLFWGVEFGLTESIFRTL